MDKKTIIYRHAEPTTLDESPFHTMCVVKSSRHFDAYCQMNPDEKTPRWEFVGEFPIDLQPDKFDQFIANLFE